MTGMWVVRMARKRDGSLYTYRVWDVFNPEGQWSGVFESWDEAMRWATDITAHIEYFLGWQESR